MTPTMGAARRAPASDPSRVHPQGQDPAVGRHLPVTLAGRRRGHAHHRPRQRIPPIRPKNPAPPKQKMPPVFGRHRPAARACPPWPPWAGRGACRPSNPGSGHRRRRTPHRRDHDGSRRRPRWRPSPPPGGSSRLAAHGPEVVGAPEGEHAPVGRHRPVAVAVRCRGQAHHGLGQGPAAHGAEVAGIAEGEHPADLDATSQ